MSNPQQNKIQNEIKQIKNEINLFEDKLKKNKKNNQFQNGLKHVEKIRIKKYKISQSES